MMMRARGIMWRSCSIDREVTLGAEEVVWSRFWKVLVGGGVGSSGRGKG